MHQEVDNLTNIIPNLTAALPLLALVILVGVAIDLIGSKLLAGIARKHGWKIAEASITSLRGLPSLLAFALAVALFSQRLGLEERTLATVIGVVKAATIVIVTAKIARLAGGLIRLFTKREDTVISSSTIFVNLGRVTVWLLGSLIVLATLDISITPLLTALGVAGLAVGLALQPTLENLFSGVQVLMSRQVEIGDFVRLETGEEGWIQDVTWRNTTIRTVSNDLVIAPNAAIGRSLVVNFTSDDEEHGLVVPLGVSYDSDLAHVERVVHEVATWVQREVEDAVTGHNPSVRFTAFSDIRIDLIAVLRINHYENRFKVRHEFLKRIHTRFAEEGIEIPYLRQTPLSDTGIAENGSRLQ